LITPAIILPRSVLDSDFAGDMAADYLEVG
jgi:hypothetical protein